MICNLRVENNNGVPAGWDAVVVSAFVVVTEIRAPFSARARLFLITISIVAEV